MWHTHAAIGASTVWVLLPFTPPDNSANIGLLVVCAAIGALLPDLDATESKIKHVKVIGIKPLVPVSRAINRDFGHRDLLHSLWGWLIWTVIILPLSVIMGWLPVVALSLGYASHLLGDACTKSGIHLLYPRRRKQHLLPKRLRVTTGSDFEEGVFILFIVPVLFLLFYNAMNF